MNVSFALIGLSSIAVYSQSQGSKTWSMVHHTADED